jgi:hypothetical protein
LFPGAVNSSEASGRACFRDAKNAYMPLRTQAKQISVGQKGQPPAHSRRRARENLLVSRKSMVLSNTAGNSSENPTGISFERQL